MLAILSLPALDGNAVIARLATFLAERESDPATNGFALAVVGQGGELIAFGAHTACPPLPRLLAVRKAVTAQFFRRASAVVARQVKEGALDLAVFHDERLVPMEGAVPVSVAGRVIGGVGVSGLTSAQDATLAEQFAALLLAGA